MIRGKNMYLTLGHDEIYDNAEFQINNLDKVGIVGVNGAGKTTLFRLLLKEIELDQGSLTVGNARIGYLPQEIVLEDDNETVWDYLSSGRPVKRYEAELEEIYARLETAGAVEQEELLSRMGWLQDRLEYFDCYDAEEILLDLMERMQINISLMDSRMKELSGGQKSKMAFARLLYSKPEILMLDEPTNHLDASTKNFVTEYLKNYHGCVLLISHDIEFLNQVITKIMCVNKITHKIAIYEGDYFTYQKKYAEEQRLRELAIVQQEREIRELADFVQTAKQASRTNHRLKRMGEERELRLEKKRRELKTRDRIYKRVKINISPKREGAVMPLEVEKISFHYPGHVPLYHELSFQLRGRERFLVVGENGVGKSTLLRLLTGILQPDTGAIRYHPKTDMAYYSQELEELEPGKTVLENVDTDGYNEWNLRAILGNFLFYDEDVNKPLEVLSPGEKARVALCKVLLQKANLLILDEPTNHLDPETQKIIGGNFNQFEGTIIVVSHNPSFVEQIGISRMLILPDGRIEEYSCELLNHYYELNTPEEERWY